MLPEKPRFLLPKAQTWNVFRFLALLLLPFLRSCCLIHPSPKSWMYHFMNASRVSHLPRENYDEHTWCTTLFSAAERAKQHQALRVYNSTIAFSDKSMHFERGEVSDSVGQCRTVYNFIICIQLSWTRALHSNYGAMTRCKRQKVQREIFFKCRCRR